MIPTIVSHHAQRGVSLFLAIIVLSIILAIVFGLSAILVGQIKILRGIGKSVVAIYAADTGIEQALDDIFESNFQERYPSDPDIENIGMDNDAMYHVDVVCCEASAANCSFVINDDCPMGSGAVDSTCNATVFCIRSFGEFQGVRRAIEVTI